jgi:Cu/Ag efflux protein CusF
MRPWRVVVLVNLALAIGLGWGYLWWGREVHRLDRELAQAKIATESGEREYRGEGVVRAVLADLNVVVISHGEIPGYMPPMTMGFRMATPNLQDTVKMGDGVRFTLRGTPPNLIIVAIEKTAR